MPIPTFRCVLAGALAWIAFVVMLVAAQPASAVQVGTVPDITWGTSRATIDRTVGMLQQSGVQWVRASVPWNAIEPDRPGAYNQSYLSDIDYAIAKAQAAGIKVIVPVQDGVPYWASADPAKYTDARGVRHYAKSYHPADYGDFARFFSFIVNRYRDQGVHAYEVWNEPNLTRFWPSGPDAGQFTQMLKAAYPAIKAADPQSTVILGGLAGSDRTYLASVYDHGARGFFDAVGIHAYSYGDPTKCWTDSTGHNAKDAFCGLDEIHKVMVANGDADKQIWITEMGWSTCDNASAACYKSGVTEAQQADYMTKAFNTLDARYPYVPVAVVYNFRNNAWQNDDPSDWEADTGLMTTQFVPKPAFFAVTAYARAHAGAAAGATPDAARRRLRRRRGRRGGGRPSSSGARSCSSVRSGHGPSRGGQAGPVRRASCGRGPHRPEAAARAGCWRARCAGRVRPAHRGWVRARFERWSTSGHRWTKADLRHARVHRGGRFSLRSRSAVPHGRWRVRAQFMVSHGVAGSRQARRSFSITG
jgi:hypothetical protein